MTRSPAPAVPVHDLSDLQRRLLRRAAAPPHPRWLAHTAPTPGGVRPVRLHGSQHTLEPATGRTPTDVASIRARAEYIARDYFGRQFPAVPW